jgi:signal transduction histidine kinase
MMIDERSIGCAVEDSGPGIDPRHFNRLFDSFYTTKESGMGLGLPVSRSIIEAHHGKLRADNNSSLGGARVSFTLPVVATCPASDLTVQAQ